MHHCFSQDIVSMLTYLLSSWLVGKDEPKWELSYRLLYSPVEEPSLLGGIYVSPLIGVVRFRLCSNHERWSTCPAHHNPRKNVLSSSACCSLSSVRILGRQEQMSNLLCSDSYVFLSCGAPFRFPSSIKIQSFPILSFGSHLQNNWNSGMILAIHDDMR